MPATTTDVETTVYDALESFGAEADAITRDAVLADIDVDSLDLAELAQIVDEKFGVVLKGSDIEQIKTVGDAIDLIAARAA